MRDHLSQDKGTLAVDLDGTLIRSDMLVETFWASVTGNPRAALRALAAAPRGRAALKAAFAGAGHVDPAALPYAPEVVDYIRDWRADGGRTALVSASDATVVQAIAAHLGIFDEAHGSDGSTNLKGPAKAAFLVERFGARGFSYIGDAPADLPVWAAAAEAITYRAPDTLRTQVERLGPAVTHLGQAEVPRGAYLRALRPHQWAKNTLIFLPMLAAHQINLATFGQSVLAFACFCLVASAVYLLNDLTDLASDRAHPRKRFRPLASGALPILHGTLMIPALLLAGLALALPLGGAFVLTMLAYLVVTTGYSLRWKRVVILDICILGWLYTVRIVAGAIATDLPPSVWLLAFSLFFFVALAAVKRQAELVDNIATGTLKARGRGYQTSDLPLVSMMALAAGYVSVLVMALYLNSPAVLVLYDTPEVLWGICLVLLYWITRTVLLASRGEMHDDPVLYALRDGTSRVCGALIVGFALLGTAL